MFTIQSYCLETFFSKECVAGEGGVLHRYHLEAAVVDEGRD
jgi:hypothetical protein